uniref:HicA toxin of toxin-antitoxin n=1 Tax=Candidatus Kentrum sp. FM TaxID=2126340 RepID=A0A450S1Y9_9GAMM|nr:MAG: HicA toxin of toxin-antitoxin [Candidatus Kentron sp. FM]VFJ46677.1 MAG: HicA toxin of toxin-antitoxin [Candidatus Kentron sp. FM]
MKRIVLIRHLSKNGCELLREGGRHSIWRNRYTGEMVAVPRHSEIKEGMAGKICKDLGIIPPAKKP